MSGAAGHMTTAVINALRQLMLRSFGDKETERVSDRRRSRVFDPKVQRAVLRKLAILDAAETVEHLRVVLGIRRVLNGDQAGQYSIRISQPWRICFEWTFAGPSNVGIVGYY